MEADNMKQETYLEQENGGTPKAHQAAGGLFLIVIGGIFMLNASGVEIMGRSPVILLALLPILGISYGAWRRYEANGRRFSREVFAILVWGLFPFAFIVAAIFGINTALIWPLALIAMGLGIVLFR
jgi:hypothetical protein